MSDGARRFGEVAIGLGLVDEAAVTCR